MLDLIDLTFSVQVVSTFYSFIFHIASDRKSLSGPRHTQENHQSSLVNVTSDDYSKCTIQKEDIIIHPSDDDASCDSNLDYSGIHCIICIGTYKHGESICWSNNDSCHHSYQSNCILEWLFEHSGCPQCREEYVLIGKPSERFDDEEASA